jgi:predicted transcriptional regulator
MKYRKHVRDNVKTAGDSLGPQLGRAAIRLGFSVVRVATVTGATRATIYSWFYGNEVSNAYRASVTRLTNILRDAPTAAAAWSQACQAFSIQQPSPTKSSSESPTLNS